ncbi:hypothetical protein [Budvicia aquatica]|nr:hypothetical protein [Budvicia aquatica]
MPPKPKSISANSFSFWFHLCEQRCQQQDNFGFYASLSSLLQAFIQQDISLLQEWIGLAESSQNSPAV